MGLVETIREVAELVQKADNIELLRKILLLQQAALDEQDEKRGLRQRIEELEEQLRDKGRLVFRDNGYWDENEGPFCSACFDSKRIRVRLHVLTDDGLYACQVCDAKVVTETRRRAMDHAARAQEDAIREHNKRQQRSADEYWKR